ncbi:MAG TPA: protein kinase [Pyrinomonadaceae bacterium]|nr:protein kinase [Pyrinomonadaceae bacterium]
MDSDLWKQIEELYEAALRLEPAERQSYLSIACSGDDALREKLESLIAAAEQPDSFLEEPAVGLGLTLLGLEPVSLVGHTIDRYKLVRLIGSGGMGVVYLAHDPRLDRNIALKLLPISITGDQQRVDRFVREARADAAISHPNVAHVYEIGEDQGWHFITMEYVAGNTLRQVMKGRRLGAAQALEIAAQMLTALAAAHEAGIVHRDVKPENVIIREDGFLKVLDFGLAKLVKSGEAQSGLEASFDPSLHTQPDFLMGTPDYMSPEQVRRQPVDGRTDIWSVGVVLYEMLTGRRPFGGLTFSEIIVAILEREPEPLPAAVPEVPQDLHDLVRKAIAKRLDRRYQTAAAMLADVRRVQKQLSVGAEHPHSLFPGASAERPFRQQLFDTAKQRLQTMADTSRVMAFIMSLSGRRAPRAPGASALTPAVLKIGAAVLLLLLLLSAALFFGVFGRQPGTLWSRQLNLHFERLHLSGRIGDMVISPDGKYVATVVAQEGRQAIYITELATASELNIVPPSEYGYSGLSFSPDGNYIYYLEDQAETGTLYRVSKLGGAQRKILANVNTPVSFSPDGGRVAFVRFNSRDDTPDLIVSRADGTAEQTLVRRTRADADVFPVDLHGAGPAWSPDGKLLACPTVSRASGRREMNIEVLDAALGTGRRLNSRPWYDISQVMWLADGSGLILAAADSLNAPAQMILLSYPGGEARRVTNDPNNYSHLSSTSDSGAFLALSVEAESSVWRVAPGGVGGKFVPLDVSQMKGVMTAAWFPDGRLVYAVDDGSSINLWARDERGEAARQLTFDAGKNFRPVSSPDGRLIYFVSTRGGQTNIWAAEADGTGARRLTSGTYEDMPSVSPDGQWVFYRTGNGIRKISAAGGSPVKLFEGSALYPVVSPDGLMLAFFASAQPDSERWELRVTDVKSLSLVRSFPLPETAVPFNGLRWTPEGRGLTYVSTLGGSANLWQQPLDGGQPYQLTDFRDADILSFAWSPQGGKIVCVLSVKTYTPVLVRPF